MASLALKDGNLILRTPYNRDLVDDLKASIPTIARNWNREDKVWEIAYMHGQDIVDVVKRNLGVTLAIPKQATQAKPQPVVRFLKVEYIGGVKERDNGEMTATGFCEGQWSVIFPFKVLRSWFEGDNSETINPNQAVTFYSVLGIAKNTDSQEIKKAYRIAAKTWHPDVNQDDTTAQFRRVQEAYEVLNNPIQRKKYDAGLYLQAQANKNKSSDDLLPATNNIWLPPKRCGYITVEGIEMLGKIQVNQIMSWQDIIESGMIMVSIWPKGANMFSVDWV